MTNSLPRRRKCAEFCSAVTFAGPASFMQRNLTHRSRLGETMSNALSGLLLMLLCAGGSLSCLAQTSAGEVLDAARAALGGKRLEGIRTLSVAGKHSVAMRMARSGVGVGPASD